jgi:uncharacterized protein Smg (DUF494 family)
MKDINGYEEGIRRLIEKLGLESLPEGRDFFKRAYNRILTPDEKKLLDTESFGYLLSLYQIGTIDSVKLEKFIDYSLSIAYYEKERLSLERTKKIVDMLLFFDGASLRNMDFVSLFRECEDELCELDLIN